MILPLLVGYRRLREQLRVTARYYPKFLKRDLQLYSRYLFANPYCIHRKWTGEYTYGETPLTTLDRIAREAYISPEDTVYDLGCGPGRTTHWLNCFRGCNVLGIDQIPTFIDKAIHRPGVDFICGDFLDLDYSKATVVYLYGTGMDEPLVDALAEKLKALPRGGRVITTSYPIEDRAFRFVKSFPGRYTWGKAEIFLQYRL